jgi:peptide/nickel transport system ATP-binding protein
LSESAEIPENRPGGDFAAEGRNLGIFLRLGKAELKVVDNFNFSIGRGEFFALVGESGSGKTMIARALMRLLPKSRMRIDGSLLLGGTNVATLEEKAMRRLRGKRVSMIFQEPMTSLNPIMTIEAQIDEALHVHGTASKTERDDEVGRLLSDVLFRNPDQVRRMYPHELSGGMRQRVMIAIALANDPTLLIADEPTTALDVTIQKEIMEILLRLRDRYSLSVLFISHDLALVYKYADTLAVLYGGVLMECGPTRQVIDAPTHPYTAALLECMPQRRRSGLRQPAIDGNVPSVSDWFEGCRFAARCRRRQPACTQSAIPIRPTRERQEARCLFPLI